MRAQPAEVKRNCVELLRLGDVDVTEESTELDRFVEDGPLLVANAAEAGIPLSDFATFMLEADAEEVADALFGGVAAEQRGSLAMGLFDALHARWRQGVLMPGALADRLRVVQLAYGRSPAYAQ